MLKTKIIEIRTRETELWSYVSMFAVIVFSLFLFNYASAQVDSMAMTQMGVSQVAGDSKVLNWGSAGFNTGMAIKHGAACVY